MVLSALCGLWDSGFGAGLSPDRIVLVAARDLDPGERKLIAALRALVRELVRASELVGFEMTEFEAPSSPTRRARAIQTVIRMIEPVLLAGSERGKRVYES